MRTPAVVAILVVLPTAAAADRPYEECKRVPTPALADVSTWVRIGGSWGEARGGGALAQQTPTPPGAEPVQFDVGFATAFGGDATFGLGRSGSFRIGPWAEVGVTDFDTITPTAGLELQLGAAPNRLRWFQFRGQGQFTVRAGAGRSLGSSLPDSRVVVGAATWGYLAPWDLSWRRSNCEGRRELSRYMIGARLVATVMRSVEQPEFWVATVGLEIEPAGAIRYLFGIRDWY